MGQHSHWLILREDSLSGGRMMTMRSKTDVEGLIENAQPIVFGKTNSVEDGVFQSKYDALLTAATSSTGAFLSPETIRYQSILLTSALFLISLQFFRFNGVKIFETLITVDNKLRLIYTTFVLATAAIFLVKSYVDVQRAKFVRNLNDKAISDLKSALNIGLLKRRIQSFFWFETSDRIGLAYRSYYEAQAAAMGKPESFRHVPTNALVLGNELREIPELKREIELQQQHLNAIGAELEEEEARFKSAVQPIVDTAVARRSSADPFERLIDDPYVQIESEFNNSLKAWFDARASLLDKLLDIQAAELGWPSENRRLAAMLAVLRRIRKIRRIYVGLEVLMPAAFALAAILYCWRVW